MRRVLLLVLLLLPSVARADDPSSGFTYLYTLAGCAEDGSGCHKIDVGLRTLDASTFMSFDNFSSIWYTGSLDQWTAYYLRGTALRSSCHVDGHGVTSAEWTTYDGAAFGNLGAGGCENPIPATAVPAPADAEMMILTRAADGTETPHYATLTTTPEPASLVLLGTGLVGLVGAMRRRHA